MCPGSQYNTLAAACMQLSLSRVRLGQPAARLDRILSSCLAVAVPCPAFCGPLRTIRVPPSPSARPSVISTACMWGPLQRCPTEPSTSTEQGPIGTPKQPAKPASCSEHGRAARLPRPLRPRQPPLPVKRLTSREQLAEADSSSLRDCFFLCVPGFTSGSFVLIQLYTRQGVRFGDRCRGQVYDAKMLFTCLPR